MGKLNMTLKHDNLLKHIKMLLECRFYDKLFFFYL